ncbi:gluconate 2-dehydrogenase subunit 3 family protein [Alteromonas confluentis]|uniref:Twin-arginine translocation pathway signal n=1 Tax=Alteromonas confluentis TaxID=1656094 RepID=A0A1E7ZA54_9ALTE|nr:gluconate 2-dehydrogenase subunit 3 family protein [Alteromonas confluentis]OFC70400.1 hypothetical protein BFC18_14650 [Alteromonas confluentis]
MNSLKRREFLKLSGAIGLATLNTRLATAAESATSSGTFAGKYFTMFKVLSHQIIPDTDTPGALACQVPEQMKAFVLKVYGEQHIADYSRKLDALDNWLKSNFGESWHSGDDKKHHGIVSALEDYSYDELPDSEVAAGYRETKELIVFHYYTSQQGATKTLHYDPVPGMYKGCEDLSVIGKTWATPNAY